MKEEKEEDKQCALFVDEFLGNYRQIFWSVITN